ncbi:DUF1279 superfamily [Basidiobolus ranarum]|uniref:DUF1279 superfamily n=1 Tax=Basidiobolus ranarum TaxID=34480 RepID=A0ABR2WTZ5_9FUNG
MSFISKAVKLPSLSKASGLAFRSYLNNPSILQRVSQYQVKASKSASSRLRTAELHTIRRVTPLSLHNAARTKINTSFGSRSPVTISQRTLFGFGKKKEKKPGFLRKYGKVATVAYLGVSVADYLFTVWLVRVGGEQYVKPMRETLYKWFGFLGIGKETSENGEAEAQMRSGSLSWTSTILIALGIHKLLIPLRIPFAAALSPGLARKAALFGWKFLLKR